MVCTTVYLGESISNKNHKNLRHEKADIFFLASACRSHFDGTENNQRRVFIRRGDMVRP